MDPLELCRICRLCAEITDNSTNLFDRKNCLVGQIKDVTGCSLRNTKDLPPYICLDCEHSLSLAHQFRKRCLESQLYFRSAKYKEKLKKQVAENEIEVKVEVLNYTENENDMQSFKYEREGGGDEGDMEDDSIYDTITIYPVLSVDSTSECKISSPIKRTKLKSSNILNAKGKRLTVLKKDTPGEKLDLICDQCGNHFTCRHHFKTHLIRHTNEKPFQCEVCPNKFFTHSELKRHMRRHTGEKPFACKHCERRFADYSTRIKHERIHTNERPFSCTQCSKTFTTSYVLKNHMLIHTGERFFKCSLCNKAFQRKTHLTVHFSSIMHKQMMEKRLQNENMETIDDNV